MDHQTCLFVIDLDTPDAVVSEMAGRARETDTHLICLLLGESPVLPLNAYGAMPYGSVSVPDHWTELVQQAQAEIKTRGNAVEQILAQSGASGDVHPVSCATMDIKYNVARRALVCDIVNIAQNLRDTPALYREAGHGVLFQSATGLLLNGDPTIGAEHIFVSWDGSIAASRAVHAALPYLRHAKNVTIACFDPEMTEGEDGEDPGVDVASWLSHHGCNVTVGQYPSGGHEIADCIQNRAQEVGSDLIVMGAYGHSRMKQAIFGGTTRAMMEQTDHRLLLAH